MATAGNFDKNNTDTIFNQDYNTIRSRVVNVLGLGSGTSGYGDSFTSDVVDQFQEITLAQWQNLRTEINKCYKHITGSNSTLGTINSTTKINVSFVNLMNEASNYVVTNKDTAFNTQLSLVSGLSATRSTAWNGALVRVCTVTWASADDMRNFFNAGGYINASLSHGAVGSGASQGKNSDWAAIIDANPNLTFTQSNYRNASANVQIRSAVTGTNYTSNYLRAWGHKTSSTSLKITVLFDDATLASTSGSGQGWIDENVTMSITTAINYYTSIDAVVSPTPNATGSWVDDGFAITRIDPANAGTPPPPPIPPPPPPPIPPPPPGVAYAFGAIPASINEGVSGTFNVNTTGVANGTTLYWTLLHSTTSAADFSPTSGSFTINSNTGSFVVAVVADAATEGSQTFQVRLRTGRVSGPIVAESASVTVNDTSTDVTYNYAPEWLDEYAASYGYTTTTPRAIFLTQGQAVANAVYLPNTAYSAGALGTRYALYRKPDGSGLAFWADYCIDNGFSATATSFLVAFFGGLSGTDLTRSQTSSKSFDAGSGDGDFYDKSVPG